MSNYGKHKNGEKSFLWDCPKCGSIRITPVNETINKSGHLFNIKSCPKCYCTIEMEEIK